jgi:hypothetical protein
MATRDPETGRFSTVANRPAMVREESGEQRDNSQNNAVTTGGLLFGNGGSWANPLGFPGYDRLYTGGYDSYRWMLQHPILRLVRAIAVSPIIVSSWEYEKTRKNVPDDNVELVKNNFDLLRNDMLTEFFVDGRDMGWKGGEPIWDIVDGNWNIVRMKPLLQDITEVLADKKGNFVGLKNYADVDGVGGVELVAPFKAWKYTYDGLNGYHYGRSWLENVRATAWKDWLDCAQQLQKLGAKIAGIVSIIVSPAGSFPTGDPEKPTITYRENAEKVIKALANGAAGAWFPSLALAIDAKGNVDAMRLLADLAGKSLTSITPVDFGSNSPAILGILARMRHNEELMFAGGLRPARTGLEGEHGTKGQAAKGTVRINPASLVDRMATLIKALLLAGMNIPEFAQEFFKTLDVNNAMKLLTLKQVKQFDANAIKLESKKPDGETPPRNPEPQGGRPTEK